MSLHPPRAKRILAGGREGVLSRGAKPQAEGVSLRETLIAAGLEVRLADILAKIPHELIRFEAKHVLREAGAVRNEVIFVRSGILAKYKTDSNGRRHIVALRFAGEGILPQDRAAEYELHAITRAELMVGSAQHFNAIVNAHPEMQRFFMRLVQRNVAIGYEWLVNCARRDSSARVAHLFCETAARMHVDGDRMFNPFTQQQIAEITCQTSVNVNRVLANMERRGLIKRRGREIRFSDWSQLCRIASFQPSYLA